MRLACVVVLVACAAAACDSPGVVEPSDADVDAAVEPDADTSSCAFVDEYMALSDERRRRECERGVVCSSDGFGNRAAPYSCQPLQSVSPEARRARACDALATGRVLFHPELAPACRAALDAWTSAPCRLGDGTARALPDAVRTACDAAIDWTWEYVNPKGECRWDCEYTRMCIASGTCGGVCSELRARGEWCSRYFDCEAGLHCDLETSICVDTCEWDIECEEFDLYDERPDRYCIAGTCQTLDIHPGDPCVMTDLFHTRVCGPDLHCSYDGDVCVDRAAPGEACNPIDGDWACVRPFECDRTSLVCANHEERCLESEGAVVGCTAERPHCGTDGHCTDDPARRRCSASPDADICPDGYACDGRYDSPFYGTCWAARVVGEACDADSLCDFGSTCADGRCVRLVPPWQPCDADAHCPTQFDCVDGVCTFVPIRSGPWVGDPCTESDPCLNGACLDGTCAFRNPGDPCTEPSECLHGCDPETHVCPDYVVVGENDACGEGRDCAEGLGCFVAEVTNESPLPRICRPLCQ